MPVAAAVTPTAVSSSVPARPRVEAFLERHDPPKVRVGFALDATASRQPTWDRAADLTGEMFRAAMSGRNLLMSLMYFRGWNGEFRATDFVLENAASLGGAMNKITCMAGKTQLEKVLRHVAKEHAKKPVAALIFIGDCVEENESDLYAAARELAVPVFLFQEGTSNEVASIFGRIADITKGAHEQFDAGSAAKLAGLLKAVAVFASGGLKALAADKSAAAQLLLTQMTKK